MLSGLINQFEEVIKPHANGYRDIKDYPWYNKVFYGPKFRWAHVEHYQHRTADIVHVVVMPHQWDEWGIYGYDVVSINENPTGLFMDITPTVRPIKPFAKDEAIGEVRPVPEWGKFSDNFVAVKPDPDKLDVGIKVLKDYLPLLGNHLGLAEEILIRQQEYIEMQRKNEKTYKMLAAHIGKESAKKFMNEVLFPDVI